MNQGILQGTMHMNQCTGDGSEDGKPCIFNGLRYGMPYAIYTGNDQREEVETDEEHNRHQSD